MVEERKEESGFLGLGREEDESSQDGSSRGQVPGGRNVRIEKTCNCSVAFTVVTLYCSFLTVDPHHDW